MPVPVPRLTFDADLRTVIEFLFVLSQKFQDVLEKLDADGGVTDTDYESLHGFAATDIKADGRGITL